MGRGTRIGRVAVVLIGAVAIQAGLISAGSAAPKATGAPTAKASVFMGTPIRVGISARGAGAGARVRLDGRDLTKRFRRQGGEFVGRLSRADGVRYGRNTLTVHKDGDAKSEVTAARTFFVLRRSKNFVRLTVRGGVPVRALIDFDTDVAQERRAGRDVRIHVRLNGREIGRTAKHPRLARDTLSLSATHGLRYGVNKLRVRVIEARHGRYALIERRFVVHRTRPLAAAGPDQEAQPGVRLRLGGRARAAHGGQLRHRWVIVRRPPGSRARLSGSTGAHPRLKPDRPGRYVVQQRVSEYKRGRASASATKVGSTGLDDTEVVTSPLDTLFTFSANAFAPDSRRGIKIGSVVYPYSGPAGKIQVLWLDRASLLPVDQAQSSLRRNTWCCDDDAHSALDFANALQSAGGRGHLVALAMPPDRTAGLPSDQYDDFNYLLSKIGVNKISAADLSSAGEQIVTVGIPSAPLGTGWAYWRLPGTFPANNAFPQQGWLMLDGSVSTAGRNFRFQPQRLPLDTDYPDDTSVNTMDIGGLLVKAPDGVLEEGSGVAGFHVVEMDPRDLSVVANQAFPTNETPDRYAGLNNMANAIRKAAQFGHYVAVQSVGPVGPPQTGATQADVEHWKNVSDALIQMNANVDHFNRLDPTKPATNGYAFFGGPPLDRTEVEQTSQAYVTDRTKSPPTTEPGALRGRLSVGNDGFFRLSLSGAAAKPGSSLYDILLTAKQTPWPYTTQAGLPAGYDLAEQPAYLAALKWIGARLPGFGKYADNLRLSYVSALQLEWGTALTNLAGLTYPGADTTCNKPPAPPPANPGFSKCQFDALVAELKTEFNWLDQVTGPKGLIATQKAALSTSGDASLPDLTQLGQNIKTSLNPPDDSVVAPILYLLQSIAEVAEDFGGPEVSAAVGLLSTTYDLGSTIASDTSGVPVGDQITTKVSQLSSEIFGKIAAASTSLDAVSDVGTTDYGRLQGLAAAATANNVDATALAPPLTTAAKRYFYDQLMPIAYWVWDLQSNSSNYQPEPDDCSEPFYEPPFAGAPDSSWYFSFQGPPIPLPNDFDPQQYPYHSYILNEEDAYAGNSPPASITDPMFEPVSQIGGLGIEKSTWFWEKYGIPHKSNYINCD